MSPSLATCGKWVANRAYLAELELKEEGKLCTCYTHIRYQMMNIVKYISCGRYQWFRNHAKVRNSHQNNSCINLNTILSLHKVSKDIVAHLLYFFLPRTLRCHGLTTDFLDKVKSYCHIQGHFTHGTESPWPLHFKHSHWWKRRSRWSKFATSHYAWGTNGVNMWMQDGCKVYMDSYMASNGSCVHGHLDSFQKPSLGVGMRENRETMTF